MKLLKVVMVFAVIHLPAQLKGEPDLSIDPNNKNQITEISSISWFLLRGYI